mmetsp:Transcript_147452/g.471489  ORF Transcript_147452/g.471489 Transcript_147452/m.471489 type:complete len:225 (+) Transcript_147452:2936-3610(+)
MYVRPRLAALDEAYGHDVGLVVSEARAHLHVIGAPEKHLGRLRALPAHLARGTQGLGGRECQARDGVTVAVHELLPPRFQLHGHNQHPRCEGHASLAEEDGSRPCCSMETMDLREHWLPRGLPHRTPGAISPDVIFEGHHLRSTGSSCGRPTSRLHGSSGFPQSARPSSSPARASGMSESTEGAKTGERTGPKAPTEAARLGAIAWHGHPTKREPEGGAATIHC